MFSLNDLLKYGVMKSGTDERKAHAGIASQWKSFFEVFRKFRHGLVNKTFDLKNVKKNVLILEF